MATKKNSAPTAACTISTLEDLNSALLDEISALRLLSHSLHVFENDVEIGEPILEEQAELISTFRCEVDRVFCRIKELGEAVDMLGVHFVLVPRVRSGGGKPRLTIVDRGDGGAA